MPIICYLRRAQDRPRRPMFTVKPGNDDKEFYAAMERIEEQAEIGLSREELFAEFNDGYHGRYD